MTTKNYYSEKFGACRIIDDQEYSKNPTWHDRKQEGNYMIVTDDQNNYFARYNPDNDGADNY